MDERLQKALEFANYRQTLNAQLQKTKIKAEGSLLYSTNGGNFKITQELIAFIDYLNRLGLDGVSILDKDNIPVHIDNIAEFLKIITSRYFEVTNDYLAEYQEIKKKRNVSSILDVKVDK